MRTVDVEHGQVVDLADVRDRERGGEHALADAAVASTRLDVHDDVDPGKRVVQRMLDAVGGRVPLADRGAGRDADDDVGEVLASRPAGVGAGEARPAARAPRSPDAQSERPRPASDP